MKEEKPHFIFHAAALKHVDLVETNPMEGVLVNVFGTRNVADAALRHGAEAFVMVSTDKAVAPSSVMGASKRAAERYIQICNRRAAGATRFITVRFGNVLGSSGSVVPAFERQIRKGGPVTLTDPAVERYFMTIEEARMLIMHATLVAVQAEKFHDRICVLDMGDPVLIRDLAEKMILLAGKRVNEDIKIVHTGFRPGEKVRESLLDSDEALIPEETREGVLIARSEPVPEDDFLTVLNELYNACIRNDMESVQATLRQLVPTYLSGSASGSASLPHKQDQKLT